MAKIIFLNPPLGLQSQYRHLAAAGSELPPLGIAILAAIARSHSHQVKILDALALRLSEKETVEYILAEKPDILGISSTTLAIYAAANIANSIKNKNKHIRILLGGPHISSMFVETMQRFTCFDIGVIGEGEATFIDLLNHLPYLDDSLKEIKGIIYRKDSKLIVNEKREFIRDLDSLPYPAWDLLPNLVKFYQPAADSIYRFPSTLLITSRGCPGRCIFCDRSVFGNTIRGYSTDYCIGMIKYLISNYGIRDIFIEDDNFLAFQERTIDFCKKIINEKIDITFSIMGRVDMVTPEVLILLKKAGCWQINYGLESGSQKILDLLGKNVTVENAKKTLYLTQEAGIKIKGLFMIGNPGEDRGTIKETFNFIQRMPIDDFHMTFFTPFPGSSISKIANKYGYYNPDWKAVNMFTPDNFIAYGFSAEEIKAYHRKAYRLFYLRPRIISYYILKLRYPAVIKKIYKAFIAFLRFLIFK